MGIFLRYLTSIILLFVALSASSQELNVENFRALPLDMTARVDAPKYDQNGDKAAIIKIVTNQTGFVFDVGMMGVVATKQDVGEIWLYIPKGVNNLTIKHPQLGVLRNYFFPEPIEEASVYTFDLISGSVTTIVEQDAGGQYLVINYTPADINIELYIDDAYYHGTMGSISTRLKYGKYAYRIEAAKYKTVAGVVEIGREKVVLDYKLEPSTGTVHFVTTPDNGASVYLDGDLLGTTPFTTEPLEQGEYEVRITHPYYLPTSQKVTVLPNNEQITSSVPLTPNFAEITIKTPPQTSLTVNDHERSSDDTITVLRLTPGLYTLKAIREGYRPSTKQIEVRASENQTISLGEPTPMYGSLEITSNVNGAEVYIDDQKRGTTPEIIQNILAGARTIEVRKDGYISEKDVVRIVEGQLDTLRITLQLKPAISVSSSYISLSADGESRTVRVNANDVKWSVVSHPTWCTIAKGEDEIEITAQKNNSASYKSGTIKIVGGGKTLEIEVTQNKGAESSTTTTSEEKQYDKYNYNDTSKRRENYWSNKTRGIATVDLGFSYLQEGDSDYLLTVGGTLGVIFNRHGVYGRYVWGRSDDKSSYRDSYIAGYIYGIANFVTVNIGAGYGTLGDDDYTMSGFEAEAGLSFRFGSVALSAGIGTLNFKNIDYKIGLGIFF